MIATFYGIKNTPSLWVTGRFFVKREILRLHALRRSAQDDASTDYRLINPSVSLLIAS